jgi:hypothetical protein
MIRATAKIVRNYFEVQVGPEAWVARPVIHAKHGLGRTFEALFSTVYTVHLPVSPEAVYATVSYRATKDEILIQVGEEKWRTRSSLFGPVTFEYGGEAFTIVEKLIGRFAILKGTSPLAHGEIGFRSIVISDYPPELERFFGTLAVGYLIRTLAWPT